MNEYSIRFYEPGDEEGIVKLLEHSFKGWPKINVEPRDHWFWKYSDNPYWKNDIVVALRNGEIIGCKHSVYFKLKMGEKVIECSLGSDLAIHTDFRRRGISRKIRDLSTYARTKIYSQDFSYYVTSNPVIIDEFRRRSNTFSHDIQVFVKINDIDLQLKEMPMKYSSLIKTGFKTLVFLNKIKNIFNKNLVKTQLKIFRTNNIDEKMNVFWNSIAEKFNFIVVRDVSYLKWRYLDPRAGNFIILLAEEESVVSGYIVLHINRKRKQYPVGYIVDVLTHPDRTDVSFALVNEALEYFKKFDVNIITSLAIRSQPYEKTLKRAGFINSRKKLNLFLGTKSLKSQDIETIEIISKGEPEKIHFMYGDIDSLPTELPMI